MGIGIMAPAIVDVRDMTCAQALALVGQAVARLGIGQALEILYNADDVKQDVLAWARTLGHRIIERSPDRLHLERGIS